MQRRDDKHVKIARTKACFLILISVILIYIIFLTSIK